MPGKLMLILVAAVVATSCAELSSVGAGDRTAPTTTTLAAGDRDADSALLDSVVATWSSGAGPTWVAEGEVIEVEGTYLQFVRVLDDSRCPPDATCVWAGELVVEIRLHAEEATAIEAVLPGDPVGFEIGGRMYSLSVVDALQTSSPAVIRILIESL